jgi:hypothetical protein
MISDTTQSGSVANEAGPLHKYDTDTKSEEQSNNVVQGSIVSNLLRKRTSKKHG